MENDIKKDYTIVIIDDEKDIRAVFNRILTKEDYNCEAYESAESFLNEYDEEDLGKVILVVDIMMPNMSGLELLDRLAKDGGLRDIPVIYLTSYPNDSEIADSFSRLNALAIDYMAKPFNAKWLITKIENLLKIKYTHDRLLSMSEELIEAYSKISNTNREIENILMETRSKNDYLILRLKKLLHDKDDEEEKEKGHEERSFKAQIQVVRNLFSKIVTTDMYLIKSVNLFLDKLNAIYFKIYYEESSDTEFMELLPETLISIHTLLADIETMKALMQNLGIIPNDIVSCSDYKTTNIYKCLVNLLEIGDITQELFDQFIDVSKPEQTDEDDDVILF